MGIFDFHSLWINNNLNIQFVKHRFDVNTTILNAFISLKVKEISNFCSNQI